MSAPKEFAKALVRYTYSGGVNVIKKQEPVKTKIVYTYSGDFFVVKDKKK